MLEAPDDKCDPRLKTGMQELVQGLERIHIDRAPKGQVELSGSEAALVGGALDTLPVILQALKILGDRVKAGDASEWQDFFRGENLKHLKKILDWAVRIDWTMMNSTGMNLRDWITWLIENFPFL